MTPLASRFVCACVCAFSCQQQRNGDHLSAFGMFQFMVV